MSLMEEIFLKANKLEYREHLYNYVWNNSEKFTIGTFEPPKELAYPNVRLDIDTVTDYQRLLQKPYRIEMTAREVVQIALVSTI